MLGEIYNSLRSNLRDPEYAEGYAEEFLNAYIATQIKVIREQRNMTQAQLAEQIGTTQAGVSRYENVNYPSWSISGLKKVARALHVRLKVSFEPFGTLPGGSSQFQSEQSRKGRPRGRSRSRGNWFRACFGTSERQSSHRHSHCRIQREKLHYPCGGVGEFPSEPDGCI
ncbi:MAG: helix-turn-helix transcriptional regulator [Terracidiphilus sp.]